MWKAPTANNLRPHGKRCGAILPERTAPRVSENNHGVEGTVESETAAQTRVTR